MGEKAKIVSVFLSVLCPSLSEEIQSTRDKLNITKLT
jgi:hypothetical protein